MSVAGVGFPDGTVAVTGACWTPGVPVAVQLETLGGAPVGAAVNATPQVDCTFEVDLPIGAGVAAGAYRVVADNGAANATATLSVVAPSLSLSSIRPANGALVTVSGAQWEPGSSVTVVAHSTPKLLGSVTTAADGSFQLSFRIDGLAAGAHRLEVTQTRSDGQLVVRSIAFDVAAAELGATGAHTDTMMPAALLLLLSGALVSVAGVRRRRAAR